MNEDNNGEGIIGGLINALERGESIQKARQSLINAGYKVSEVDYAVRRVMGIPIERKVEQASNIQAKEVKKEEKTKKEIVIEVSTRKVEEKTKKEEKKKEEKKVETPVKQTIPSTPLPKPKTEIKKAPIIVERKYEKIEPIKTPLPLRAVEYPPLPADINIEKSNASTWLILIILVLITIIIIGAALIGLFWEQLFGGY